VKAVNKFLNRLLPHGSNVLVVIGLVLVVIELKQNQAMMRAQIRNELSQEIIDLMSMATSNKELAEVIVRANAGESLTPAESIMLDMRAEANFRYWENAHYQYREGLYDESEFSKHLETMREVMVDRDKGGLASFWCRNRTLFSDAFQKDLDGVLPADYCTVTITSA
jgi:hypothetical protein